MEAHPKAPDTRPSDSAHPRKERAVGEARARRKARGIVMAVYYAIVVVFIAIAAGNVVWQVWAPAFRSYPRVDCRAGLRELVLAIERARQAAGSLSEAGEDSALAEFRRQLSPEWDRHDEVAASCRSDHEFAMALDVIERLRYAEERAVRREVTDLAPLRRNVAQISANQLQR